MISPNTEVRSVSVKDGICYVNFNEEFLNTDYKVDPYVTIYAIGEFNRRELCDRSGSDSGQRRDEGYVSKQCRFKSAFCGRL